VTAVIWESPSCLEYAASAKDGHPIGFFFFFFFFFFPRVAHAFVSSLKNCPRLYEANGIGNTTFRLFALVRYTPAHDSPFNTFSVDTLIVYSVSVCDKTALRDSCPIRTLL